MSPPLLPIIIGVDGGGTRCRVRIRDERGHCLGESEGGASNVHSNITAALLEIRSTIHKALSEAGLDETVCENAALGLGLAGVMARDDGASVRDAFSTFKQVFVESDAIAACIGAHAGQDGGLVIAGTGSAGALRIKGQSIGIGGRGFRIGDDGSAARIGWDALRQALLAADDLKPSSPLTRALMKRFSDDPRAVTHWASDAKGGDYGALAPLVFEYAAQGDPVALPLIKMAARSILDLHAALERRGAERVALVGGLSEPLRPWIALEGPDPFVGAQFDAVDGAILMAGGVIA